MCILTQHPSGAQAWGKGWGLQGALLPTRSLWHQARCSWGEGPGVSQLGEGVPSVVCWCLPPLLPCLSPLTIRA